MENQEGKKKDFVNIKHDLEIAALHDNFEQDIEIESMDA